MSRRNKLLVLLVMSLWLTAGRQVVPAQPKPQGQAQWVKYLWGCARPSDFPRAKLGRLARATMKRQGFAGFGTWGDRAFILNRRSFGLPVYFVPLDCGGSGNCTWGVFTAQPARLLGLLPARAFYARRGQGRFPDFMAEIHLSAVESTRETYRFRHGRYSGLGDKAGTDEQHPLPRGLARARLGCRLAER